MKVGLIGSGSRHDGELGTEVIPVFLLRSRSRVFSIARRLLMYTDIDGGANEWPRSSEIVQYYLRLLRTK